MTRLFASHRFCRLVLLELDEERVTEPVIERPLKEIDRDDHSGLEPSACRHLVGCDAGPPSALRLVGQVDERAFGHFQLRESTEERLPRCGRETGTYTACEFQISAVEVADED